MRMQIIVSIVTLLCAVSWFAGCGGSGSGVIEEPNDPASPLSVSVSPNTLDAAGGQATVTYANTAPVYSPSLEVRNGSGATVRSLISYTQLGANTRQATWDGKDGAGQVVAAGQYRVVFSGNTADGDAIPPAAATVTVSTGTVPPPPPPPPPSSGDELGQTVEGQGSANFAWLKYAGRKLGVGFQAPKSGTLREITLQWKKSSGYGAGTYGKYNFELHTNGSGNFASGTIIGRATNIDPRTAMDGYLDGALHFPITATVTAGQIYHLVVTNVDPNPGTNWSSPNGLMTRVVPWDGTGNRAAVYESGSWRPWSSQNNPWNTTGGNYVNGQHIPTMLSYTDGTNHGGHYYSARTSAPARFHEANKAGQYIYWNQSSATISRIGISLRRTGTPGALLYRLEQIGSGVIASGTVNTSSVGTGAPVWAYATLSSPVTLQQGQSYRLYFESPTSSSSNHFFSAWVYGEQRPTAWLEAGWGGTRSYYTQTSGSSWTTQANGDLSFSLQ